VAVGPSQVDDARTRQLAVKSLAVTWAQLDTVSTIN
jgi:hypothetical protein